jgi:nitroreductase
MELYEAMRTQRAIRRLKPDAIPEDVLQRIFTAATCAPTGGNMQPWRIVAVRDPRKKQTLEDLYRPYWDAYVPGYRKKMEQMPAAEQQTSARAIAAGDYLAQHMHEAPVIAVFCFNPGIMTITDKDQPRPSVVGGGSVYPAVQNLLLACRNEGVGAVLTTLLCMEEPKVRALLALPDGWYTCAYVPMGYPVGGGYGPIARKPVEKMVFTDAFGSA